MSAQTNLNADQLDGTACIGCGRTRGPMVPAGVLGGGQVFRHEKCTGLDDARDKRRWTSVAC